MPGGGGGATGDRVLAPPSVTEQGGHSGTAVSLSSDHSQRERLLLVDYIELMLS